WWKHKRITRNKVLAYLKNILKKQNKKPKRDEVKFVKTSYGIRKKAYSIKARNTIPKGETVSWSFTDLSTSIASKPNGLPKGLDRLIEAKMDAYRMQDIMFSDLGQDREIANYLRRFYFIDKDGKKCFFNKIQREDLNLAIQKK